MQTSQPPSHLLYLSHVKDCSSGEIVLGQAAGNLRPPL